MNDAFLESLDNLEKEIEKIERRIKQTKQFVVDTLPKKIEESLHKAYEEYGAYQQKEIKTIFNDAVRRFYDDYEPKYYKRRESLYNVLDMKNDEYGMAIAESENGYMDLFDQSAITNRKGGSLFHQVFVEGWHGGAKGISEELVDIWGAHPSPGIPYYRKSGMIKDGSGGVVWHRFAKWGRKAKISKDSPYRIFSKKYYTADRTYLDKKFDEITDKHIDDTVDDFIEHDLQEFYNNILD